MSLPVGGERRLRGYHQVKVLQEVNSLSSSREGEKETDGVFTETLQRLNPQLQEQGQLATGQLWGNGEYLTQQAVLDM